MIPFQNQDCTDDDVFADEPRPRLFISFSGGRSSAVMLRQCLKRYSFTHEIVILFANTGCEAEETLRFVDAVDRNFCQPLGYKVTWVEAVIHGEGKGPTAKLVTYETAARDGEPFEAAIAKHGIFTTTHPNCTGRLKVEPMTSYLRVTMGWGIRTYDTAIGIRADEIDRVSSNRKALRYIYPLADAGVRKEDVKAMMKHFEWDLDLPGEHHGNCSWCWKKSSRKLLTLANEDPSIFDFPKRMEAKYGHITKSSEPQEKDRVFFRGNNSAEDIIRRAKTEKFEPYTDWKLRTGSLFSEVLDLGSGCGESCEAFGADI